MDPKRFTCPKCGESFDTKEALEKHKEEHKKQEHKH